MVNSQDLNRYAYVLGNPVMGVDPSGLVEESICSKKLACFESVGKVLYFFTDIEKNINDALFKEAEISNELHSLAKEDIASGGSTSKFDPDLYEQNRKAVLDKMIEIGDAGIKLASFYSPDTSINIYKKAIELKARGNVTSEEAAIILYVEFGEGFFNSSIKAGVITPLAAKMKQKWLKKVFKTFVAKIFLGS